MLNSALQTILKPKCSRYPIGSKQLFILIYNCSFYHFNLSVLKTALNRVLIMNRNIKFRDVIGSLIIPPHISPSPSASTYLIQQWIRINFYICICNTDLQIKKLPIQFYKNQHFNILFHKEPRRFNSKVNFHGLKLRRTIFIPNISTTNCH